MRIALRYSLLILLQLGFLPTLNAYVREVTVPAGTVMECTLSEPSFSSATTSVGDPFLCYPRNIQEFGHPVFPRSTYLVGHLEDAKEPGHFVGKGYLLMTIDRIGLPSTDIPLRAKVIAVAGYKVDKSGKVIGHGHATRDVVEWMLPPLWPWKVLTLPAKGPRPNLKGEVRVTLRVMDDFAVPQEVAENKMLGVVPRIQNESGEGWHHFGEPAVQSGSSQGPQPAPIALADSGPVIQRRDVSSVRLIDAASKSVSPWPENVTVFALTDGAIIPVQNYQRNGESLNYVLEGGEKGSVHLDEVDWSTTSHLNWSRGIRVNLHEPQP